MATGKATEIVGNRQKPSETAFDFGAMKLEAIL
jgi:hypothetical protein